MLAVIQRACPLPASRYSERFHQPCHSDEEGEESHKQMKVGRLFG